MQIFSLCGLHSPDAANPSNVTYNVKSDSLMTYADEMVKAIKLDDFDLVLLDLAMPEFSGMDIINSLKAENPLEKKNIIILTASALHEDETEALVRDGIRSVLKKPISIEELTSALQQFHR